MDLFSNTWEEELETQPLRTYSSLELFAGAGGLALGLERAGFSTLLLNEWDKHACATLRHNRPHWPVLEGDVCQIDFSPYRGKIDLLAGGFPCQAFSYAGKGLGFEDIRGTMFFQFARAIQETLPKIILGENVKGLLNHDQGRTLKTIKKTIQNLGYRLIEPRVLNAVDYFVPQKRERLVLIAIREDCHSMNFQWPEKYSRPLTMRDALKAGVLFSCDVPLSGGQKYPEHKQKVLELVPAGGCWRDLPDDVARAYMKKSYFLGGGRTGMARRLSWEEASLTLTCSPSQNQTERCHPDETRPLSVREYARIQTFPDEWVFSGSLANQYKQIGNAVPVNFAHAIGRSLIRALNGMG